MSDRAAYHSLYGSIHSERKALYAREWRERNREAVRDYRAENAAHRATQQRLARYRRRVARWLAEADEIAALYAALNGGASGQVDARSLVTHWQHNNIANTCARGCGRAWRHITHAVPLYAGGSHSVTNLVPVCGRCG